MFDTFREPHFFTFSVIFSHIASIFTFSVDFFSYLATFSHIAAFSHLRVPHGPLGSPALPDQLSISLPGISRLPGVQPSLSGVRPSPGIHRHPHGVRWIFMGIPPWKWKWGRPPLAHRPCWTNWAFPFRVSLACPGFSPPSRELGHPRDSPAPPWGPVNFQGRGKHQPSGRHHPSTGGPPS